MASGKNSDDYIVAFPHGIYHPQTRPISNLAITRASSPKKAARNVLYRRTDENLSNSIRGGLVNEVQGSIESSCGKIESFTYEISNEFKTEDGKKLSECHPMFKACQESFLAEEIMSKRGCDIYIATQDARRYLAFYNEQEATFENCD